LTESLDLNNYKKEYLKIPQVHYVGEKDKVIPSFLTEDFVGKSETTEESNISIVKIPNANHVSILEVIDI
jgi:hypothetical protein